MIQFRSEGIILDVQPDQDVTFTLDNPIFEDDRVPVAVSTNVEFKLQIFRIHTRHPAAAVTQDCRLRGVIQWHSRISG